LALALVNSVRSMSHLTFLKLSSRQVTWDLCQLFLLCLRLSESPDALQIFALSLAMTSRHDSGAAASGGGRVVVEQSQTVSLSDHSSFSACRSAASLASHLLLALLRLVMPLTAPQRSARMSGTRARTDRWLANLLTRLRRAQCRLGT
jgi:hypothetical protein